MADNETNDALEDFAGFRALLDTLDPPNTLEVTDVFGEVHRLPSAVSARAQIAIFRKIEEVQSLPVAEGLSGDFAGGNVVGAILALSSDPKVLEALAECFSVAFPLAVARASKRATEEGLSFEDACDLFPIEEVIGSLVPLFVRLMRRGMKAAETLGAAREAASTSET